MAWRCTGSTNQELISNLYDNDLIESKAVRDAMSKVDRAHYVRDTQHAYEDSPQLIGFGATISAPHMHAMCLELIRDRLQPGFVFHGLRSWVKDAGQGQGFPVIAYTQSTHGATVLDVGAGSGYLVACMAHMIKSDNDTKSSKGHVYGIEHIPQLAKFASENIANDDDKEGCLSKYTTVTEGDGRKGLPSQTFDAIHVGAAAPVVPQPLLDQLKVGGKLVIPVGPEGGDQALYLYTKVRADSVTKQIISGVRYVPLTDRDKQIRDSQY